MPTDEPSSPSAVARAPHLLYIAWGFPPCRGGGVYRALATANLFAAHGWRVTVLTATRETFERYTGADISLENEIDPRVRVVRVPFAWPVHETDIGRYGRLRVYAPRVWRKLRGKLDLVRFPEEGYGPWRAVLESASARIHRDDPVDLTIATANPNVTFAAAGALHARFGVPFVMDYRDAWLLNVFTGEQIHRDGSRAARWERRLISKALEVWFVNDPIRDWHAARYPDARDRMHTVANGWDPDLLAAGHSRSGGTAEGDDTGDSAPDGSGSRPLTFGYLGTVSPNVPLTELVDGWIRAKERGALPADARLAIGGYLGYYSIPRSDMLLTVARGREHGVEYVGPVPKIDVASFYASVDVLLLALGKGRYVTSGKVFEYLATGKPVVSVHHAANAASDVMRGYPAWVLAQDLEPDSIATALSEGADLSRTSTAAQRAERRRYADSFRRDRQFAPRISSLREVVAP